MECRKRWRQEVTLISLQLGATVSQDTRERTASPSTFPVRHPRARMEALVDSPRQCPTSANVHQVSERERWCLNWPTRDCYSKFGFPSKELLKSFDLMFTSLVCLGKVGCLFLRGCFDYISTINIIVQGGSLIMSFDDIMVILMEFIYTGFWWSRA